jgi:hypothetical protein
METTTNLVMGYDPAAYGVTMTPELSDFLEVIQADAFDAGTDVGEERAHEYAGQLVQDVLHDLNLPALAADLTELVIEYVDTMGTALAAPDEHERRLIAVRDALLEATR